MFYGQTVKTHFFGLFTGGIIIFDGETIILMVQPPILDAFGSEYTNYSEETCGNVQGRN